jgi:hypothetical protein
MPLNIILNIFILLLFGFGIISLLAIIQGWFGLTVASGNEDKIDTAKSKMILGAICLTIVMCLFTVGNYFIKKTETAVADSSEYFNHDFNIGAE